VLGVAQVTLPLQDDDRTAFVSVSVRPGFRGQGIGRALAAAVDDVLDAEGRTTAIASTMQAPEPAPGPGVVTAPTGSGRVSLETPDAVFATSRGFTLEQVARVSQLDVPAAGSAGVANVEQLLAAAAEHAGPEYRTHTWNRTVPQEWLAPLAVPWGRMSTDVPHADLDTFEEKWDADRVAAMLEQQTEAHQQTLITAVEHVPTGDLVAFTLLSLPDFEEVDFGFQGDTLVLAEHRGRRLGMLAKATNLLAMIADRPRIRRVHTMNAEENSFMLAINVALGFRGVGVLPTWQRHG
jgi:GNAT superfamily N-acetyltransferase